MSKKTILPNCKKCRKETVLADAGVYTSKPYFYCRTCKIEVDTWGYEVYFKKITDEDSKTVTKEEMPAKTETSELDAVPFWNPFGNFTCIDLGGKKVFSLDFENR